jgi:nitrous oxidase accessory protein
MKNKKSIVFCVFSIFLLTFIQPDILALSIEDSYQKTIYVDDDNFLGPHDGTIDHPFRKIQDGVDGSNDGDTVFVFNGTYYENIIIDKKICLFGENKNTTVVDGNQEANTIHVKRDNVVISGFTIKNSSRLNWYDAGVRLNASNTEIKNNIIKDNMLGVFGKKVENIVVYQNSFINDSLTFSLYDKETEPVYFSEKYFSHFVQFNTVNDKPLIYVKNQENIKIPENAGQVIAVNCKGLKIKNLNLEYTDYGCMLINCNNCIVKNTSISNCDGMLWLISSSYNIIEQNNISNNFEGVCLDRGSNYNIIRKNIISKNQIFGIIIETYSNYNTIENNDFINNNEEQTAGQVYFTQSHGNKWKRNFWNQKRVLPKIIFGKRDFLRFNIPWLNIDFKPSKNPNNF